MTAYHIAITLACGTRCSHAGLFAHGCDAVCSALDLFPTARRISARKLP